MNPCNRCKGTFMITFSLPDGGTYCHECVGLKYEETIKHSTNLAEGYKKLYEDKDRAYNELLESLDKEELLKKCKRCGLLRESLVKVKKVMICEVCINEIIRQHERELEKQQQTLEFFEEVKKKVGSKNG